MTNDRLAELAVIGNANGHATCNDTSQTVGPLLGGQADTSRQTVQGSALQSPKSDERGSEMAQDKTTYPIERDLSRGQ